MVPVFRAMANASLAAGFDLCLMSPDEHDLKALAPLSPSTSTHLTAPHVPVAMEELDRHSAFVTLFHDHDWEPGLLKSALTTQARFIGSLGSRRTHKLRLEGLRGMGVGDEDLARLHGPIGLVPSLRDAPFIAISALSGNHRGFSFANHVAGGRARCHGHASAADDFGTGVSLTCPGQTLGLGRALG